MQEYHTTKKNDGVLNCFPHPIADTVPPDYPLDPLIKSPEYAFRLPRKEEDHGGTNRNRSLRDLQRN